MGRWKRTWGKIDRTPGLSKDLAIIATLTVAGVLAAVTIFSNYQLNSPLEDRFEFAGEFDMLPGVNLAARQEVRIAGVPVGEITDARPGQDGGAELVLEIEDGHPVYRDARLLLRTKSPLNIMYVALEPGSPDAGELEEGEVIPLDQTQRITQPYELLDELDARTRTALTNLVNEADVALLDAAQNLPSGLAGTEDAALSFEPVVRALAERRDSLRRLVTAVSQVSTAAGEDDVRLARLVAALQSTLDAVADGDRALDRSLEQLPTVVRTLRTSLRATADLTTELSPTLSSLSDAAGDLPAALDELTSTARGVREVARAGGPVLTKARPVVADLRPLTADLDTTLENLAPVTSTLPSATAQLVPWLDNLGAFVYNTSSSFSLGDANGGLGRANVVVKILDPTGGGL